MIKVGVIGYGYWGPNIVRNFNAIPDAKVVYISDIDPLALKKAGTSYPGIKLTKDYHEIINSTEVDVVAIITPINTHYQIADKALTNGKHIFVEKPFTTSYAQALKLCALADKKNLQIMVDHTFIFTGAVKKIKQVITEGMLGDLYYYDSTRVNLGLFRHDINVIWDLAPHDFSIMDFIINNKPVAISAHGISHFEEYLEDVAYIVIHFENNLIAHFNLNWLSPVKVRQTLIGGQHKMLVWNDLEADEKIKIYDKGINIDSKEGLYQLLVEYRSGDMYSPRLEQTEALYNELAYFVDCLNHNKTPVNDGQSGLRIVNYLETASTSLKNNGKIIEVKN
jgi:predicted dehydrogenase